MLQCHVDRIYTFILNRDRIRIMVIFIIWVMKVCHNSDCPLFRSTQIWTHLSTIQIKLDLILGGNLRLMKSKICLNVHYSDPVCTKGDCQKILTIKKWFFSQNIFWHCLLQFRLDVVMNLFTGTTILMTHLQKSYQQSYQQC